MKIFPPEKFQSASPINTQHNASGSDSFQNEAVWLNESVESLFRSWIKWFTKKKSLPRYLLVCIDRTPEILTTNTQNETITDKRSDECLNILQKNLISLLFCWITTLLFCFSSSVAEKETHWEWYCCPGLPRGSHSLYFGCDQIPLLALFHCSAENKERKWGRWRRWRIISGKKKKKKRSYIKFYQHSFFSIILFYLQIYISIKNTNIREPKRTSGE